MVQRGCKEFEEFCKSPAFRPSGGEETASHAGCRFSEGHDTRDTVPIGEAEASLGLPELVQLSGSRPIRLTTVLVKIGFRPNRGFRAMNFISGGCLCGKVRYQCDSPPERSTLCHCATCRRASGANAQGWVTVATKSFHFTTDLPADYRSSNSVTRTFCQNCGTPLTYWHATWPDEIAFSIGSMDAPNEAPPSDHTWMSEAIAWDKPNDGLKRYEADRP